MKTIVSIVVLLLSTPAMAELMAPTVRTPQFPSKDQRMLLSEADIVVARQNIATYDTAKAIADKIIARADRWVSWDDAALRALAPTADVPWAFNVGTAGCPKCGKEIYAKGGTYPWILDPEKPFQVECPVDGTTYPSNDYAAYYASGLEDKSLLTGDYPDDGWGWEGPDGHRYWFVAYANHWIWRNHVIPAAHYLARAYILTGDKKYAHKAAVLLDKIAEVYPNMDYHGQSRYGQLQAKNGSRYEGKIVNLIWATGVLSMLAESYDFVWDAIDDNTVTGKTAAEVRANIEANLLEEGIDGYFSGKIRGNFGMHQKALVYAGLARQYGNQSAWFDGLLNEGAASYRMTGLNYALYNLVYRDGPPYETSPGYNFSWVVNITTVAEALQRAGYDAYGIDKMRALYDGVLDIVQLGQHTPSLGDSGSVYGGLVGNEPMTFQRAWRAYGDPRYRQHLQAFGATGASGMSNFESLFHPIVEPAEGSAYPTKSRLLDGYGMAILNNPANTVSLALYYGYKGGHGHFDRLSFELFAHGKPLMPDLGYPDFMNAYVPGIYTWSKNTIAHNTVTVDAARQIANYPGVVHRFVDDGFARALDIDAAATYPQTSEYRRRMLMVDMDDAHSYVIDLFTVAGGAQHDYSLHGPPGSVEAVGGAWTEPAPGTLAGPDVPVGYIYDDPKLAPEEYTGSYAGYTGSGFQHLAEVQRLASGEAALAWSHERDESARLRMHPLSTPGELVRARAQVSPVKHTQKITYLIQRNQGEGLRSHFATLIEPHTGTARIQRSESVPLAHGDGLAAAIRWSTPDGAESNDLVLVNAGEGPLATGSPVQLATDAAFLVLRHDDSDTRQLWATGGTFVEIDDEREALQAALAGAVRSVDPVSGVVDINGTFSDEAIQSLPGRIVHFENDYRRTAHPIAAATAVEGGVRVTLADDLRVGHLLVGEVRGDSFTTPTGLAFAPVYDGAYVTPGNFTPVVPIEGVRSGTVMFAGPLDDANVFSKGEDAWIVNVGPGDRIEIPRATEK